jgi:hypothetical protein
MEAERVTDAGLAALSEGFCPDCLALLEDPAGNGGSYCRACDAWHWLTADGRDSA